MVTSEVWDVQEFTYLAKLHGQVTTKQERSQYVDAYWSEARPEYVNGDGSESFVDFFLRAQHVVHRILGMRERFTMVFSHEQFITAARWILASGRTFRRADISADMMTSFRYALTDSPVPNGAILPVAVQNYTPRCGDVVTHHLGDLLRSGPW
jgi:broad specificity phosphatase PhoE